MYQNIQVVAEERDFILLRYYCVPFPEAQDVSAL